LPDFSRRAIIQLAFYHNRTEKSRFISKKNKKINTKFRAAPPLYPKFGAIKESNQAYDKTHIAKVTNM
jgi:hypothetical protein